MPCDNCNNGCVQVTTDQCVNYTGAAVPALEITVPTNLLCIENTLINTVVSFLDGHGINITINPSYYCSLVTGYLPVGTTPNLVQLLTALVRAACDLQNQVTVINGTLTTLNSPYTVGCLDGVTSSSKTHDVVQAIITKLCTTVSNLSALTIDVNTNYVKISDLNTLIQAYLNSISGGTQQYLKMIPYTAVEYYGPLTNFDGTGAGINSLGWNKIYLCNGNNGTPDKRGRVGVGAIVTPGVTAGPLNPSVDPAFAGNPNYAIGDTTGANSVTLLASQMPSHTHTATASAISIVDEHGGHFHYSGHTPQQWGGSGTIGITDELANYKTSTSLTGITVETTVGVTNAATGGGAAHPNIQPVIATYYIMYIP